MRQKKYWFGFGLLLVWLLSLAPGAALAAGEGEGGGGGPAVPLLMDWCYPTNGETGVSVTPVIQCKYSHNVAQGTVKKRNLTLLSLAEKEGTAVATAAFAADAQLEFGKRQFLYLWPLQPLKYNTTYVVTAKAGIQAKNSMATEVEQYFEFTTCGAVGDFNASGVSSMVEPAPTAANSEQAVVESGETVLASQTPKTAAQQTNEIETKSIALPPAVGEEVRKQAQATDLETDIKKEADTGQSTGWLLYSLSALFLISLGIGVWQRRRQKKQ